MPGIERVDDTGASVISGTGPGGGKVETRSPGEATPTEKEAIARQLASDGWLGQASAARGAPALPWGNLQLPAPLDLNHFQLESFERVGTCSIWTGTLDGLPAKLIYNGLNTYTLATKMPGDTHFGEPRPVVPQANPHARPGSLARLWANQHPTAVASLHGQATVTRMA